MILWILREAVLRGQSALADILVNFEGAIHISGMTEARAVKFCALGDYVKSCQRDDKSPSKGHSWAHRLT